MAELEVSVLSPAKVVAKVTASQVEVPGALGYLGILPGHTRLVAELGVGALTVDTGGAKQVFFVSGGYLDVADDHVTILADVAEKAADIDVKAAEKSRQEAEARLAGKAEGTDYEKEQLAVKAATERLAVAARKGG